MFVIARNDNWVWNYRLNVFWPSIEPDATTYIDAYHARKMAVRVGSLQGSTGEPLIVMPIREWAEQAGVE